MKLGKHRQNCHLSTTLFLRQRIICIFAKMAYARATPASQEGYFVINRSTLLLALGLATISASAAARSNTEFESLRANIRNSGASSGSAVKALCNKYYKIAFDTKYHNVWNEKEEQICARDPSLWYSVWRAKLEIYFYNALSGRDAKIASLRRAVAQMENAKKAGYQSADVQLDKWRDLLANLISAPGVRNAAPVPRGQTVRADDRLAPQLTFGQRAEWRPPATMESVGGSGIFKVFRDRSRCESDPQKAEFYLSVPSEAAIAEHLILEVRLSIRVQELIFIARDRKKRIYGSGLLDPMANHCGDMSFRKARDITLSALMLEKMYPLLRDSSQMDQAGG